MRSRARVSLASASSIRRIRMPLTSISSVAASLFELLCTARTQAGEEIAGALAARAGAGGRGAELAARRSTSCDRASTSARDRGAPRRGSSRAPSIHARSRRGPTRPPWHVSAGERALALAAARDHGRRASARGTSGGSDPGRCSSPAPCRRRSRCRLRPQVLRALRQRDAAGRPPGAPRRPPGTRRARALPRARAHRSSGRAAERAASRRRRRIARLQRLINLLDAHRNQVFALLSFVLLWRTNFALAIEAWHAQSGSAVPRWLARDRRARGAPRAREPRLRASRRTRFPSSSTGCPLRRRRRSVIRCLPDDALRVGTTSHSDDRQRLLIVSGSNMSGKSTLLRDRWDVNVVLALAGAPVRAAPSRAHAVRRRRRDPHRRLAAGRDLALLRRGAAAQPDRRPSGADRCRLLFLLDEILQRHQLARSRRSAPRRSSESLAARRARPGHHPRPGPRPHRRRPGARARERALRGPPRGRSHVLRLHDAPGGGDQEQRAGPSCEPSASPGVGWLLKGASACVAPPLRCRALGEC